MVAVRNLPLPIFENGFFICLLLPEMRWRLLGRIGDQVLLQADTA
jgi:hypothetical protein